jgi:hypothetical protein
MAFLFQVLSWYFPGRNGGNMENNSHNSYLLVKIQVLLLQYKSHTVLLSQTCMIIKGSMLNTHLHTRTIFQECQNQIITPKFHTIHMLHTYAKFLRNI